MTLRFGGLAVVTLLDSTPTALHAFQIDGEVQFGVVGATGDISIIGDGRIGPQFSGAVGTHLINRIVSTTFDTIAAIVVDVQATIAGTSTLRLDHISMEIAS